MTWKERLRALVLAGGALAVVGCDDTADHAPADMASADMAYMFVCNANPDPCCLHPDMKGCPSDGGAGD
jgi:hypothetical protein